jgi:hypothetical protein
MEPAVRSPRIKPAINTGRAQRVHFGPKNSQDSEFPSGLSPPHPTAGNGIFGCRDPKTPKIPEFADRLERSFGPKPPKIPRLPSGMAVATCRRERNFWMQRREAKNRLERPQVSPETERAKGYRRKSPQKRPISTRPGNLRFGWDWMVGATGIEPVTPSMSTRCLKPNRLRLFEFLKTFVDVLPGNPGLGGLVRLRRPNVPIQHGTVCHHRLRNLERHLGAGSERAGAGLYLG